MPATSSLAKSHFRGSIFLKAVRKAKVKLRRFNKDEQGMNTVEAIILLFVAAVVLVVFFTFIWPLIRDKVYEQLENLFGSSGREDAT